MVVRLFGVSVVAVAVIMVVVVVLVVCFMTLVLVLVNLLFFSFIAVRMVRIVSASDKYGQCGCHYIIWYMFHGCLYL